MAYHSSLHEVLYFPIQLLCLPRVPFKMLLFFFNATKPLHSLCIKKLSCLENCIQVDLTPINSCPTTMRSQASLGARSYVPGCLKEPQIKCTKKFCFNLLLPPYPYMVIHCYISMNPSRNLQVTESFISLSVYNHPLPSYFHLLFTHTYEMIPSTPVDCCCLVLIIIPHAGSLQTY